MRITRYAFCCIFRMLYYLSLGEQLTCCLSVPGPIFRNLGMWQKNRAEISRKATIHRNALYLSAGAKPELRVLARTCTLRDGWL